MKKQKLVERVGQAMLKCRLEQGYSQEDFATQIAMHRTYYSAVERGEKNLTLRTLERICDGLSVAPSDLLHAAENER